jgi:hypothetical protein
VGGGGLWPVVVDAATMVIAGRNATRHSMADRARVRQNATWAGRGTGSHEESGGGSAFTMAVICIRPQLQDWRDDNTGGAILDRRLAASGAYWLRPAATNFVTTCLCCECIGHSDKTLRIAPEKRRL